MEEQSVKSRVKSLYQMIQSKDSEIQKLTKVNSQQNKKIEALQLKVSDLTERLKINKKPGKILPQEPVETQ